MKPILLRHWVGWAGAVTGLFFFACGGNSETNFDDDGSGGEAGETGGTGGSTGGTSGTGGVDGVCEDITPCGGDPLGTWNVSENCTEVLVDVGTELGCEGVVAAGSASIEGTFTFADGVMTQNTIQTVDVTMTIDDACAETLTGLPGVTAADVCPLVNAELMMNMMTPGTCAVAPDGCRCDISQPPTANISADPYEVVGNQLIITSSTDGTTSAVDFCQEGTELHMHAEGVDLAAGTLGSLTILLERQ